MTEKQTYHEHRMEATFCRVDKEDILLRHLLLKGSSLTAYARKVKGLGATANMILQISDLSPKTKTLITSI